MSRNKQTKRDELPAQKGRPQPGQEQQDRKQSSRSQKDRRARASTTALARWPWLWLLGTVVVVLVVFHSVVGFRFLSWDDQIHLHENPHMRPPWLTNIAYFWQTPYQRLYIPLSYTFFALEAMLSGALSGDQLSLNPAVFHVGNLLLHAAAVAVAWRLLWRLTGNPLAAFVGALVFGIHPLQAESVAWISETRGVLSSLFVLLALWHYVNFSTLAESAPADSRKRRPGQSRQVWTRYLLATACYALALLAKPSAVVAPLMLAVIEIGLLGHRWRRVAVGLAPWVAMAIAITIITKSEQPTEDLAYVPDLFGRLLVAGDTLAFYLSKLVLPINLAVYCRPPEWVLESSSVRVVWLVPTLVLAVLAVWGRRGPWLASALLFLAAVSPVLGLVPFSFQTWATVGDRYVYLAMFGPALAAAVLIERYQTRAVLGVASVVLVGLGVMTHRQLAHWHDSVSLFERSLTVNDRNYLAHNQLGQHLAARNDTKGALEHYQQAIAFKPDHATAHNNLGMLYSDMGRLMDAITEFNRCVEIRPTFAPVHNNLGNALMRLGRNDQALREYNEALRLDPDSGKAHLNLANFWTLQNKLPQAATHYRRVIQLDPRDADAHNGLAVVLMNQGDLTGAIKEMRQALELRRGDSGFRKNLDFMIKLKEQNWQPSQQPPITANPVAR